MDYSHLNGYWLIFTIACVMQVVCKMHDITNYGKKIPLDDPSSSH
jgi:hypothetical protein